MSESIRDRIARVLSKQTTCDGQASPTEMHYRQADAVLTEVPALRAIRDCEAAHEQIVLIIVGACDVGSHYAADAADEIVALFPVLAGVNDEMVEAGARALADWDGADWDCPEPEFDTHEVITKRAYRVGATAVLTSALGSRDADAPGDRSTT